MSKATQRASAAISNFSFDEAESLLRDAFGRPNEAHGNAHFLASAMYAQEGFAKEAYEHARRAVEFAPHSRAAWSQVLTVMKMRRVDPGVFLEAHRRFGEVFFADESNAALDRRPTGGRRLRIGLFGSDGHMALSRFLVFAQHSRHEIAFFYRSQERAASFKVTHPNAQHVGTPGPGEDAATAARALELDVAIDLSGHGPANWLDVFARRIAPVQITWLDYLATTGLPAMDYRLTDWIADPAENDALHTETLLRLPCAAWQYTPWPEVPPPTRADALSLGSACIPLKFCDETLALWNQVLLAIPNATLTLIGFLSDRSRKRVIEHFDPEPARRLRLFPRLPVAEYLSTISRFAVALDPLNFSGGTSTLDCLAQGVPVATRPGILSHSRTTASILGHLGCEQWIAADTVDYTRVVQGILCESSGQAVRAETGARLRESSLMNAVRFAELFDAQVETCVLAEQPPRHQLAQMHRYALANPLDQRARQSFFSELVRSA